MCNDQMKEKQARSVEIKDEMDSISSMLIGQLLKKHNRVKRKDGSIHVSPAYYTFQYLGSDGKRKWKRIPKKFKPAVEKLTIAGNRYRKLEKEYTSLITEISLMDPKKKAK